MRFVYPRNLRNFLACGGRRHKVTNMTALGKQFSVSRGASIPNRLIRKRQAHEKVLRCRINATGKRFRRNLSCARLGVSVFLILALTAAAAAEETIALWRRWEHVLVSDRAYANPCVAVKVGVRFEGPNSQTRAGLGFWDADRRFVIRCAFPTPGEWRWRTTCSDVDNSGLHHQYGVVRVNQAAGTNSLTRHGYLRVSDDGRLLVHADGTPFLWIGDTCWAAPVHVTEKEWPYYVSHRASQGYSILQLAIAPDWALATARPGPPPFFSKLPDITKPNPRFFQQMDRQLALANDHGLAVMMCGLMETPHRYPPPEQIAVMSRYVAARYSSFAVIFSPSFDSGIHETEALAAADAVREAAPASLITMHMGTGVGPRFHAADWLSFDMYQSGHNGGDAARQSARAISMPAEILSLAPRKPIVNGEAIYEGDLGGAYDVRRTAWLSFLSGAVGYTAGINQIYAWKEDALARMDLPSSKQVSLLGSVLRAVPWWNLTPAPERILNQPKDRAGLMAFALTADKMLGLAYLPQNDTVTLDLRGCASAYNVLWINPATGESRAGTTVTSAQDVTLAAPDARDWGVLLVIPQAPALAQVKKALAEGKQDRKKPVATITFGTDASLDGLVHKSPRDGQFVNQSFEGVQCLVNEKPRRNSYLYLDFDDRLAFRGGPSRMRVEVRLQSDAPLEGVQLQYDAKGPPIVTNIYRPAPLSWRKQDGDWTTLGFVAESPYLGNRQNSGADFRVYLGGSLCRIASLKVSLEGAEQ
jgi:hypothetical protein